MKRILTLVLAAMMLVTAMPVGLLAEQGAAGTQKNDGKFEIKYDDGTIIHKEDYLNKTDPLKINPVKTDDAETLIKNPKMPNLYTVRSDYKVERGDDLVVFNLISQQLVTMSMNILMRTEIRKKS